MLSKFKMVPVVMPGAHGNISHHRLKSYYDSLGLTQNATSNEIKKAYYDLSKQFHPDVNNSVLAIERFRDVTTAYEVLGNVRLRRLYDKGSSEIGRYAETRDSNAQTNESREHHEVQYQKFYQSRSNKPPSSGRTPIYNFDEWTRNHYGQTFARNEATKAKKTWHSKIEKSSGNENSGLVIALLIFGTVMYLFSYISSDSADQIQIADNTGEKNVKRT